MMWNRLSDLGDTDRVSALRRRLGLIAEVAGIDVERAMMWTIAREIANLVWYVEQDMAAQARRSAWVASALA
jgi:streptomycin 6-kinase